MKRVITALILTCVFLTSCSNSNINTPTEEAPVVTGSTISETLTSTLSDISTNKTTIVGVWEDSIATKQRTQGVSDEKFSNFTDKERKQYFEEFGTVPGITLEFKKDGTFSGNIGSDVAEGKYELKSDGSYHMIFTAHENIWTAIVNGDSMIFSVDIPGLKRIGD